MWSTFQQPGDILFTRSYTFGGQLNLLAQRTLTLRRAGATHVILCIAPGLYIHSNKGRGVEFDRAEDLPLTVVPTAGESCLHRAVRPNFAGETSSRFVELSGGRGASRAVRVDRAVLSLSSPAALVA
jgi:hypothetical protein